MPFEFSGQVPIQLSTSDAFKPLAAAITPIHSSSASQHSINTAPSFGTTTSSGSTPSFGTTSFRSSPLFRTPTSPWATRPAPVQPAVTAESRRDLESVMVDTEFWSDTLSKALRRAKVQRLAVFGTTDRNADALVAGYEQQISSETEEGGDSLEGLRGQLEQIAQQYPEAMRFIRYTFNRAVKVTDSESITWKPRISASSNHDDEANINYEVPETFPIIEKPIHLRAIQSALHNRVQHLKWTDWRDSSLAAAITRFIASGESKTELKNALNSRLRGQSIDEVDKFGEWSFRKVAQLQDDFKTGFKAHGIQDLNYFGLGLANRPDAAARLAEKARYSTEGYYGLEKESHNQPCCNSKRKVTPGTKSDGGDESVAAPFRFMDLPAELRMWVYRSALIPGMVSLESCAHHMPYGTTPSLTVGLLATCKQIYEEAAGLLMENTFIVNLYLDSTPTRPVLHRSQLPKHILPNITKLMLFIDATRSYHAFCDFSSLQALTALTSLRISAMESSIAIVGDGAWEPILNEILIRVPKNCIKGYGSGGIAEVESHIQEMMGRVQGCSLGFVHRPIEAKHTEASVLEAMAKNVPESVHGSKSGENCTRLPYE